MGKSTSDIIVEEFDKVFSDKNPTWVAIKELMNNINPSRLCLMCRAECGKSYLICVDCYAREKLNESPTGEDHDR